MKDNTMKKDLTLQVAGMHCQSCELLIQEELKVLQGLSDIQVNHKDGIAHMRMDPKTISISDILGAIKRAGYEGKLRSNGKSLTATPTQPVKITIETTTDAFPTSDLLKLFSSFDKTKNTVPVEAMTIEPDKENDRPVGRRRRHFFYLHSYEP